MRAPTTTGLQRRVLIVCAGFAIGMPIASTLLKREVFDPARYYVYFGGKGPFGVLQPPTAAIADEPAVAGIPAVPGSVAIPATPDIPAILAVPGILGEPRTQFRAGDWIGFTSDLTVEADVGLVGDRILIRMSDATEVYREQSRLAAGTRRSGEKAYFMRLPVDLRPGKYELRLKATFLPKDRPPAAAGPEEFRVYAFEVVAA